MFMRCRRFNPFFGDPVPPGQRPGRVIDAAGSRYRLVDDEGRIFRAEGLRPDGRMYRRGDRVIVLAGVVLGYEKSDRQQVIMEGENAKNH